MATTFTIVSAWFCDSLEQINEHGGKVPPGEEGEADTGFEWVRSVVIIKLHREGAGLSAFTPLLNTTALGSEIVFENGQDSLSAHSALTFKCIENPMTVIAPGIWRESIVWRFECEWYQRATSAVPDPFGE